MRSLVVIACVVLAIGDACGQEVESGFGKRQLAQLLEDRPEMQEIIPEDDPIRRLVIRRFNSGDGGRRVYWDHRNPLSGREAENSPSQQSVPAFVRLTDDDEVSGRDKWCMLVFEFENLQNSAAFEKLMRLAVEDGITRKDFSLQCVELELKAGERARKHFRRYPIPGATAETAPQYLRLLAASDDIDEYVRWLDTRDSDEYDPRDYFAKSFDQCVEYREAYRRYFASQDGADRGR